MKRISYKASILFSGSFLCYFLQYQFKFSPVIAASLIGLLGTFLPKPKTFLAPHFEALLLTGAFIGMGSFFALHSFVFLLLASFLAASIYLIFETHFHGFGGRMGFIAFISSFLSIMLEFLIRLKIL